jgi:hypothetical protein
VGIEDRLRRIEESQSQKDAEKKSAAENHAAQDRDRAVIAQRLLDKLGMEALALSKKRSHPKALEILLVSGKTGVFGNRIHIQKGRVFTLLRGDHRWGDSSDLGVSDAGQFLSYSSAERHYQPSISWVRYSGYPPPSAASMAAKVKAEAERMGCVAAAAEVEPFVAYGEPLPPRYRPGYSGGDLEYPSVFFLGESGKLMYGTGSNAAVAEDWVAEQMTAR